MTTKILRLVVLAGTTFSAAETMAFADSFTYQATGTVNGYSASAVATIVTSVDSIFIQVTDTVVNPTSINQNLSGVELELSPSLSGSPAVVALSGAVERTVASDGSFMDVSDFTPAWTPITSYPNFIAIEAPTEAGIFPAQTIIGSAGADARYSNADASITRNTSNNPFLAGTTTFVIGLQGNTAGTQIERVNFFFGLVDSSVSVPGTAAPEPSSLLLFGTGLFAINGILIRSAVAAVRQAWHSSVE